MTKFLYIELTVVNGDYTERPCVLKTTTSKNFKEVAKKVAGEWVFGLTFDKVLEGYTDGNILISLSSVKEIPESDFKVLKKYLTVL